MRFPIRSDAFHLDRATHSGAFFDVIGRRSALFGYENRTFEAWVYPLKIIDDFALSFRLDGYPLDIDGRDIMASIQVRPDSTTLIYAHAAFTVRQIMFAPIDRARDRHPARRGQRAATYRHRLVPAPAPPDVARGPSTAHAAAGMPTRAFTAITRRPAAYAAVLGSPPARDVSVMPYQEEPRDVPARFVIEARRSTPAGSIVPIVIAGSVEGRAAARTAPTTGSSARLRTLYGRTAAALRPARS